MQDDDVILVAPSAFKGTLGPRQVAEAISAGARRAVPGAAVLQCPISDGGDGLLDAVLPPGSLREHLKVTGPLGDPVSGELGWIDPETALFESATACGIALLAPDQLDPLRATTRGVGEMIWEAVERGARAVVVGLGGAATVDGGTGGARGWGGRGGGVGLVAAGRRGGRPPRGRRLAGPVSRNGRGLGARSPGGRVGGRDDRAGGTGGGGTRVRPAEGRWTGGGEALVPRSRAPRRADDAPRPRRPRHAAGRWRGGRAGRGTRVLRQGAAAARGGVGAVARGIRRGAREGAAGDHRGGVGRSYVARRQGLGRSGAAGAGRQEKSGGDRGPGRRNDRAARARRGGEAAGRRGRGAPGVRVARRLAARLSSGPLCPLPTTSWRSWCRSPSGAASCFNPRRSTAASAPCGTTGRWASSSRRTSKSAGGAPWCTSARTSRGSTPRS